MTASALEGIRQRQRGYARKSSLLFGGGVACALAPMVTNTINVWVTGTPWWHSVKWMSPFAWLLYLGGVAAFQLASRGRRYRKAADILAGAVVRAEVNPSLPDEYWSGIEMKVEKTLNAPLSRR